MNDPVESAVRRHGPEAREFLKEMIRYESTPGSERELLLYCAQKFSEAGCECEMVPVPATITQDPEYSFSDTPITYEGRSNLVARVRGAGKARSLILQSHSDVVPAGEWSDAFVPREQGSFIVGRGACDAKGQIATIWLALRAVRELDVRLAGSVSAQIVVEEELGGNGALALIRQGYTADAVIVFEGTRLHIHPANRGAIWFRIRVQGSPCHMGRKHEGISAIDLAYKVILALYDYEKRIVADSAGYRGFERYTNPVQVNVGTLHAGTWPSMVAAEAVIEGGVGFLPNRSMEQVKHEVREAIESIDDPWLREHYVLEFPKLHNDSYEIDYSHPVVTELRAACLDSGLDSQVFGWNVSCDARLYARIGGMPTVVFGPGDIAEAHAVDEKIDFEEVIKASEAAVRFIFRWCGAETRPT